MEKFTAGLTQGISSILDRRKSREGSVSPEESSYDTLPEIGVDFEVEEEQVMKGLELIYQDRLNEADEYFETLKVGNTRFSLHHAEVAAFVALMSLEPEDVEFATTLLTETVSLAELQAKRWRTHSNMKKVNEAVDAMKTWALKSAATALKKAGEIGAQASAKLMPAEDPNLPVDDDDEDTSKASSSREDMTHNHRARRMRLWALLIQGECHLMTTLLQVVAAGETWTTMVKVGFYVKRCWSIYQHCQKKMLHLQKEWVSLGGTLTGTGELSPAVRVDDDDSDDESEPNFTFDMRKIPQDDVTAGKSRAEASSSRNARNSQNYDPELSAPEGEMVYQGIRAAAGNLERLENGIKEDQELASLRIGIQFGMGAFNLLISLIPTSYQKAIELIGVPGDRNYGISLLRKVSGLHHCRAPLAAVVLLHYNTVLMGLLPFCQEHAMGAKNVLSMLPIAWKESSIFRLLQARLCCYESNLQEASALIMKGVRPTGSRQEGGGLIQRLTNLTLDEHAWCLLLKGEFVTASEKFGILYQETKWFKPLYACMQAACCWEADDKFHREAAKLLRDIPGMVASKKTAATPMEQFAIRIANDFIIQGQAPLFPALEIIAVYNGFQHMDMQTLNRHLDRIGDALMNRSPRRASDYINAFSDELPHTPGTSMENVEEVKREAVAGQRKIPFQSRSRSPSQEQDGEDSSSSQSGGSSSDGKFQHKWTKASKVLCRYLMALCQRSLGDLKQAESNLRYVVSQTDVVPGNIVPYACFEWGSMLLEKEATSPEGLNLLEKSINFPLHEFQTRLKFVVSERLRMFRRACENNLSSQATTTSALNLRRVSELLRTVPFKPQ